MAPADIIEEDFIRKQILEAATHLFQVHGFRKVAMDDVAKAIGKGRSSLYYYFKNKSEMLVAVIEERIAAMITAVSRAVEKEDTAEEKLRAFFKTRLEVLKAYQGTYKNIDLGMDAQELSTFNAGKWTVHKRIMKEEAEILQAIFTLGVKTGEFRTVGKEEMETFIFVLLSAVHGVKREMATDEDFSMSDAAAEMMTTLALFSLKA